jgi:hypothetical protein
MWNPLDRRLDSGSVRVKLRRGVRRQFVPGLRPAPARTDAGRRLAPGLLRKRPSVTYETLDIRLVGSERITLVRHGNRFRVVSALRMPTARVEPVARVRAWTFRSPEVALRAFRFVVATERVWDARFRGVARDELRAEALRTSIEFHRAAMAHRDPAPVASTFDALDALARLR